MLEKPLLVFLISGLLVACEPSPGSVSRAPVDEIQPTEEIASFTLRNEEIRDDMIRMLDEARIDYSIDDSGAILYKLADAEAIDRIGNEAISEYITRN